MMLNNPIFFSLLLFLPSVFVPVTFSCNCAVLFNGADFRTRLLGQRLLLLMSFYKIVFDEWSWSIGAVLGLDIRGPGRSLL